eukprot:scaffold30738_cov105-Isochrysis_galbana.AAC.2
MVLDVGLSHVPHRTPQVTNPRLAHRRSQRGRGVRQRCDGVCHVQMRLEPMQAGGVLQVP